MNWLSSHIKTTIALFTTVGSIIGFLIGLYVMEQKISNDIQFLKDELQSIRDNDLYWIKHWIGRAK